MNSYFIGGDAMSNLPLGPWHRIGNFATLIVTLLPATVTVAGALATFVAPTYRWPLYVPGATAATAAAVTPRAAMSAITAAETVAS